MNNLGIAIRECIKNDYFHFSTLFIKQSLKETNITLIGINHNAFRARKDCQRSGEVTIDIYEISLDYCMTLILSHDILLNSLFSNAVCLKDDLNISRNILQSLRPILLYNKVERAPAISMIWDVSVKEETVPDDELVMRFFDISDSISCIFNIVIPIQNQIENNAGKYTPSLQFYNINGRKDAVFSTHIINAKQSKRALLAIQKMLYLQSSEFNCQNIRIPYCNMMCTVKAKSRQLYDEISTLTSDFQYIILSREREKINEDVIITEMLYAFILVAKIFFPDYSSFKSFNEEIYKRYTWTAVSDTIKYLLSHNMIVQVKDKIAKEHNALCMTNAKSLFTNYADLIMDWKSYKNLKKEYHPYLKQLMCIKDMNVKNISKSEIVTEIIEQLMHSFDISSYYYSYIPYCVNFVRNEI